MQLLKSRAVLTIFLIFLLGIAITGCGYRFSYSQLTQQYRTICVPYVAEDHQGVMTNALIRSLIARTPFTYRSYGSDLILKVLLFEPEDTTIGFAYALNQEGTGFSNITVSNEARLALTAQFTLIDQKTATPILGPIEVRSTLDYDYEPDLGRINANAFSLGQLEMQNLAQDAAFPSLCSLLAQKIVDYINHCW